MLKTIYVVLLSHLSLINIWILDLNANKFRGKKPKKYMTNHMFTLS